MLNNRQSFGARKTLSPNVVFTVRATVTSEMKQQEFTLMFHQKMALKFTAEKFVRINYPRLIGLCCAVSTVMTTWQTGSINRS